MNNRAMFLFTLLALCYYPQQAVGVVVFDDACIHDIDYPISEIVEVYNGPSGHPTTVNVLPGAVIEWQLKIYQNSHVNIFGGSFENDLWFYDQSRISISGGVIKTHISTYGSSQVAISGGEFGENYIGDSILSRDQSQITLSGGILGLDTTFDALENGIIIIQGTDFSLDYGSYVHLDFPSGGHLVGKFTNGDPIHNDFSLENSATMVLVVPEPSTFLFLSLGNLVLVRRRYRSSYGTIPPNQCARNLTLSTIF